MCRHLRRQVPGRQLEATIVCAEPRHRLRRPWHLRTQMPGEMPGGQLQSTTGLFGIGFWAGPGGAGSEHCGACSFCGKDLGPDDGGRIISRLPLRWNCKDCRRVDQAVTRAFGSVNFVRDMPADRMKVFYQKAATANPKEIKELCSSSVYWEDCVFIISLGSSRLLKPQT